MPGMSLIYTQDHSIVTQKDRILQALDDTILTDAYKRHIIWEHPNVLMGVVSYDAYPYQTFEDERFHIYVEGKIYNRDTQTLQQELTRLLAHLADGGSTQKLTEWVLSADADCVVIAQDKKTNTIVVFNDSLGRLPIYYWEQDKNIIIGRDLRFMTNLIEANTDSVAFDPYAIAEYLIFGYSLGGKTIYKGPRRCNPGTLLMISDDSLTVETHHTWNFDEKRHTNRNREENIREMIPLFYDATKRRYDTNVTNLLSMSGGFDSRMVGAALVNNGLSTVSATFLDHNKGASQDADIARQIAEDLDMSWELHQLPPITGEYIADLIQLKNGLCSADLAVILPFFHYLQEKFGTDMVYWTGDGGDRTLKDLRAQKRLKNLDDLLGFTLARNHKVPPKLAAQIVGLNYSDLHESIRAHLATYPETSWRQRYAHFWMYERAFNWLFENEDRNRIYFWSTTPYYGIEFWTYAMNVPDNQKVFRILHRDIIKAMKPELADIVDENIGMSPTSLKYIVKFALKQELIGLFSSSETLARLGKRLGRRTSTYADSHPIFSAVQEQISRSDIVSHYLNPQTVTAHLSNKQQTTRDQLRLLLSVAGAIESFDSTEATLRQSKYAGVELL